jgi:nucleotide-binding universal stress UspA family protein
LKGATVQNLIVPVDGSETSWRAVDAAIALARRNDAHVDIVEVVFSDRDVALDRARLEDALRHRNTTGLGVDVHTEVIDASPAMGIAKFLESRPDSTVVMTSHGRGRSAALLGSVTEDMLRRTVDPVLVIGPQVNNATFEGPVVVPVDGTDESEAAIPLAVAWATRLGVATWIVHMSNPLDRGSAMPAGDLMDTAYVARLAGDVARTSGRRVDFDELHGTDPIEAVSAFATSLRAGMIVASTHARTGWSRLAVGSVSSGFVRDAECPVLEQRPPQPGQDADATSTSSTAPSG